MKKYLPFLIVALAAALVVAGGAVLYRAKRPAQLTSTTSAPGSPDEGHVLGNPNAAVTLEEYGDFQCPPCGKLAEPLNQLEKAYQPRLRLVFHNFPLPVHAHARDAAIAAEAAALQGKFWEMHDVLYREQPIWSKAPDAHALFKAYAGMIGLDLEKFERDVNGEETKMRVEADQKRGASLGVQNTPTIFINNHAVDPKMLSPDALRAQVDAALRGSSPSS